MRNKELQKKLQQFPDDMIIGIYWDQYGDGELRVIESDVLERTNSEKQLSYIEGEFLIIY